MIPEIENPKSAFGKMNAMKNSDILKRIDEITAKAEAEDRDLSESEAEEVDRLTDQAYATL